MQSMAQPNAMNDVILKKSEPAPFFGVLVSEPRYRKYTAQDRLADELMQKQSVPCPPQKECEACPEVKFDLVSFAGGISVGVSAMAIIYALKK